MTNSNFRCPYISKKKIWEEAEKFRDGYWPETTLPVDIEKIVENRLRLNIEPEHGLLNDLDIDAYLRNDLTGIVVDYDCYMNEKYMNRLRFSFAQELGHYFLHRDIYAGFSINDLQAWKRFMQNIADSDYGFFEYQANEFAGRALVPRERLISELDKCLQQIRDVGLLKLIKSDPDAVLSYISAELCKPFGVSYKVIELRVKREELWPPKTG